MHFLGDSSSIEYKSTFFQLTYINFTEAKTCHVKINVRSVLNIFLLKKNNRRHHVLPVGYMPGINC